MPRAWIICLALCLSTPPDRSFGQELAPIEDPVPIARIQQRLAKLADSGSTEDLDRLDKELANIGNGLSRQYNAAEQLTYFLSTTKVDENRGSRILGALNQFFTRSQIGPLLPATAYLASSDPKIRSAAKTVLSLSGALSVDRVHDVPLQSGLAGILEDRVRRGATLDDPVYSQVLMLALEQPPEISYQTLLMGDFRPFQHEQRAANAELAKNASYVRRIFLDPTIREAGPDREEAMKKAEAAVAFLGKHPRGWVRLWIIAVMDKEPMLRRVVLIDDLRNDPTRTVSDYAKKLFPPPTTRPH